MIFVFAPRCPACKLQRWAKTWQIFHQLRWNTLHAKVGRQSVWMKWGLNPSCFYKTLQTTSLFEKIFKYIAPALPHHSLFSNACRGERLFHCSFVTLVFCHRHFDLWAKLLNRKYLFFFWRITVFQTFTSGCTLLGCSLSNDAHHLAIVIARMCHIQTVGSSNYLKLIAAVELVRQWFRSKNQHNSWKLRTRIPQSIRPFSSEQQ